MREIKFRAWDTVENSMLDWTFICQTAVNRGDRPLLHEVMTNPRYIKLQFTGLKDKNGKDIYEGDIQSYGQYSDGSGDCLFVVVWDKEGAAFGEKEIKNNRSFIIPMDIGEIVGDIHRNPELLKP